MSIATTSSTSQQIIDQFTRYVVPTYARFPLVLVKGKGSRVWDAEGREYLDFGGGIAVTSLGHSHPALVQAISDQAATLIHTSNLYYTPQQGELAGKIVSHIGPGKCFFCNSGAEANEGLYKLARKFGHDSGRFEIITTHQSFHGRTLAGIAATGQEKVKKGFEPAVEGFRQVPFHDLETMKQAITDKTAAILVECIQGESGIFPVSPEYLLGLRKLCDERKLLLLIDAIQCGIFRTGKFISYQRILEGIPGAENFRPDGISLAKSIGSGFPLGGIWIAQSYSDLLGPGTHGTTYGGTPLACSAALAVLREIESSKLADNARQRGEELVSKLRGLKSPYIKEVRGYGLLLGVQLVDDIPALRIEGKTPAALFVNRLHDQGLLAIPSATPTIRLLPALNITSKEVDEAVSKFKAALDTL
jgi:acetylornithine/N-succinyldiaminopimelate aminotransferase